SSFLSTAFLRCGPYLPRRAATRRRQLARRDSEALHVLGQFPLLHERRGTARGRRRGLEPVAALPRQPEEAAQRAVIADDQGLVGNEAAQARPAPLDALDFERRRALDAVRGDRDVQLFGLHVARLHRRFVGRRAEYTSGLRQEIELLVDVAHDRPAIDG